MPNSRFTKKEDTLAKKIATQYIKKGYSRKRAKAIGYATVVKIKGKGFRI